MEKLRDPRVRAWLFQIALLAGVISILYFLVHNTLTNMERQGIATGFGFLDDSAGFGVIMSLIDYSEADSYGRVFFVGLLNTLLVSIMGIIFATLLGFVIGVARLSHNWLISKWAAFYIETFRNIPLLLHLFFWYFAVLSPLPSPRQSLSLGESVFINNRGLYLPKLLFEDGAMIWLMAIVVVIALFFIFRFNSKNRQSNTGKALPVFKLTIVVTFALAMIAYLVSGLPFQLQYPELKRFNFSGGIVLIPEFIALLLALSLYTAAFVAEIVRSGIEAVSHGQTEAAQALGLNRRQTLKLIIIPQAMRIIIPPLTNQYLNLTKNSSLAAAIAYPDLVSVFAGTVLNQTGQAVEVIAITMAVYLTISLSIAGVMNWYNTRKALVER